MHLLDFHLGYRSDGVSRIDPNVPDLARFHPQVAAVCANAKDCVELAVCVLNVALDGALVRAIVVFGSALDVVPALMRVLVVEALDVKAPLVLNDALVQAVVVFGSALDVVPAMIQALVVVRAMMQAPNVVPALVEPHVQCVDLDYLVAVVVWWCRVDQLGGWCACDSTLVFPKPKLALVHQSLPHGSDTGHRNIEPIQAVVRRDSSICFDSKQRIKKVP